MNGLNYGPGATLRASAQVLAVVGAVGLVAACSSSSAPSPTSASGSPSGPSGSVPSSSGSSSGSPAVSSSAPMPVPSTAVPPSVPGGITSTVPSRQVTTAAPVPLHSTARFTGAVSVRLTTIARVTATGRLPGEISGPALSLTVSIANASSAPISTGNVVVNVLDKAGDPLVLLETASHRFGPSLRAGASGSGVYVFHLPTGFANPATVSVSYSTSAPVVLFVGVA